MINTFPSSVYAKRLQQASQGAMNHGLRGVVIGPGPQLEYLTGLRIDTHERFSALIIPADFSSISDVVFVVPSVDRGDVVRSAIAEMGVRTQYWDDGEDAHTLAMNALSPLKDSDVIGVDDHLEAAHLISLMGLAGQRVSFVLANTVMSELFINKDPDEIAQLRSAGEAIDKVHAEVPHLITAGRTEAEVAEDLHRLIAQEHSAIDFIIVGSGPNGANPHHDFSDRILNTGDIVVVDIGGTFGAGYHSDCTRTFVVGGPQHAPSDAKNLYAVLEKAQEAAVAHVHPGVTAESVDNVAREIITQAGYGEYFIHRTGHGIGLSTHEEPFIMKGNKLVLQPGMAFSIEPGIYIPGKYGARIEDIVVVTESGCERLNNQPRTLQ